jgi:hypothetical protein
MAAKPAPIQIVLFKKSSILSSFRPAVSSKRLPYKIMPSFIVLSKAGFLHVASGVFEKIPGALKREGAFPAQLTTHIRQSICKPLGNGVDFEHLKIWVRSSPVVIHSPKPQEETHSHRPFQIASGQQIHGQKP